MVIYIHDIPMENALWSAKTIRSRLPLKAFIEGQVAGVGKKTRGL